MLGTTLIALLSLSRPPGLAAVFCVDTPAKLTSALQTASNNGESDEIRLKTGDYAAPASNGFFLWPARPCRSWTTGATANSTSTASFPGG